MSAFFDMGGYAAFIWPCYGATAIGMIWLGYGSYQRAQRAAQQLAALTADEDA